MDGPLTRIVRALQERRDPARISPTAHYTGHVWYRNGLSDRALLTRKGFFFYRALQPTMRVSALTHGGLTVETFLLQRHLVMDHLLERAIAAGKVGQVVEIAAGLSPRGLTFARRHRRLIYLEGDLPDMAREKRDRLQRAGLLGANHRVEAVNLLLDTGEQSLFAVADRHLKEGVGTAVVTEGLLMYFDREAVEAMWGRLAGLVKRYGSGLYVSDLHVRDEHPPDGAVRLFTRGLSGFAGGLHMHYADAAEAKAALCRVGFERATLHRPRDWTGRIRGLPAIRHPDIVRVIEAGIG